MGKKKKKKEHKREHSPDNLIFYEAWGIRECIKHLQDFCEDNQGRYITKNFYQKESGVAEETWVRYFGTFPEYRKQARVVANRAQTKALSNAARHASVDEYRKHNERHDWGDNYIRVNKNRFKTILFGSDFHDIEVDKFFLRVFLDTAKRLDPDVVSLVGDIFDLYEFSKYTIDPREFQPIKRIKFVHNEILGPLRENCPNTQIDLVEGNHEARLLKHLADSSPTMRILLSDLHDMSMKELLGLDEYEVNYVSEADLATFTARDARKELEKNYRIYFGCMLAHHFPHGKDLNYPGVNGHHHEHKVWQNFSPHFGVYEWHQLGCGHKRRAAYCDGAKWGNGFAIAHIDTFTKATIIEYIPVTDYAVVGGKWYHREDHEKI